MVALSQLGRVYLAELGLKYPTRPVNVLDPYNEQKRLRDQLRVEIEQLRADVIIAQQESERLRGLHVSNQSEDKPPKNADEVIAMLQRASELNNKKMLVTPPSIFSAINLFLPFNAYRPPSEAQQPVHNKPLVSHHPLPLDNPLPYLQVFSPLEYTQVSFLLPPTPGSSTSTAGLSTPLLRQHNITASHPSGLFSARMEMIVNSNSLSIDSLSVLSMSPTAEAELGSWARDRAKTEGVIGRDISTICWGMGRWTEVSIERAKFWLEIDKDVVNLEARTDTIIKLQKRGKRKRGADEPEDGDDELADEANVSKRSMWTMKEMLLMMGRQEMKISGTDIEITISWSIGFDWTGEVESAIQAVARTPAKCEFPEPIKFGNFGIDSTYRARSRRP